MGRFTVPDGWSVQAFRFALDCTAEQEACLRRQFGGRRYARNWAVRTLKEDITRYRETGEETAVPSLAGLRRRWNQVKDTECTDAGTGEVWWPQISKEAFSDGIKAAVDAYWNWHSSRTGTCKGRRVGFPRFAKKGRDRDRVTFTTGAIRVEPDRRHVTLPRIGTVRVHENTRRLQRLTAKGKAWILAATVSRHGTRLVVAFRVLIQRPIQPRVTVPGSRVGVDVGVRVLATVANPEGEVLERVPNPRPLETALRQLRHLGRELSRRTRGSSRYRQTQRKITRLQRRVADIRAHHIHALTTRLAKTHGEIVAEGLDVAGMLRQKGLSGARGPQARPVRLRPQRDPPPAGLQDRLVRIPSHCRGPLVSLLPDLSCLRAPAGHRMEGALGLRPVRDQPPARRQRRDQPRALRGTPLRGIASLAQSGPRSSAEPTVRPGPAGQVAVKRGREPANRLGNNPETGCQRVTHHDSPPLATEMTSSSRPPCRTWPATRSSSSTRSWRFPA